MFTKSELENLEELLIYLEDADRGFVVVEVNQQDKQEELLKRIHESNFCKKILEVDFVRGLATEQMDHLNIVKKEVLKNPETEIVLILNLTAFFQESTIQKDELIRDINFSRDIYASLNKLLVFFLPSYFVDDLIRKAVDFWSFVSVKFDFIPTPEISLNYSQLEFEFPDEKVLKNRKAFLEKLLTGEVLSDLEKIDIIAEYARVLQYLYDFDNAEKYYLMAVKYALEQDRKDYEADCLYRVSTLYKIKNDYGKAIAYSSRALELSKEINDKRLISRILMNLGTANINLNKFDNALECLNKSLVFAKEVNDKELLTLILNHIGMVYGFKKEQKKANELFMECLELARSIGFLYGESLVFQNLGNNSYKMGDYEKAIGYYMDGLEKNKRLNNEIAQAVILHNIGIIYKLKGDYTNALIFFNKGLQIYRKINNPAYNESAKKLMAEISDIKLKNNITKSGRNDPCPCGSGKKYKKCCGS